MDQRRSYSQNERSITLSFNNDKSYRNSEADMRNKYITQLQIAKYSKNSSIFKTIIINAGQIQGITCFYICGQLQPKQEQEFQNMMSYFICQVEQYLSKYCFYEYDLIRGIILIYLNTGSSTHSNVSKFFQAYRGLPVEYFAKLQAFYIVHGNIFIKSWFWFQSSIQISTLKQKISYIAKLAALSQLTYYSIEQCLLLPQYVIVSDNSYTNLKKSLEDRVVDQADLQHKQIVEKKIVGLQIYEYELSSFGIPICVSKLVSYFYDNQAYLCLEGIFRKNAAVSKENQVAELLQREEYDKIVLIDDPYAVAGMLKKIFDKMLVPLIPYPLYHIILKMMKEMEPIKQVEYLRGELYKLPDINYRVFIFIIGFLTKVTEFKEQNKMTTYNMSVVFAPCFIRPEVYTMDDLQNAGTVVKILQVIMDNYKDIFPGENYEKYLEKGVSKSMSMSISGVNQKNISPNKQQL